MEQRDAGGDRQGFRRRRPPDAAVFPEQEAVFERAPAPGAPG